jgi:hypothetical protein
MGGYRAKQNVILHRVIDLGVKPTPKAIALLTGLSRNTIVNVLNGEGLSAPTMATLSRTLELPIEELVEPIPAEAANGSRSPYLRAARG